MGKDALSADQQLTEEQKGEQFKGEQFNSELRGQQQEQFKEPFKGDELNRSQDAFPEEVAQPAGGFHGDKWHTHEGEAPKIPPLSSAQLMEDPNAGGFHGDALKEQHGEQFNSLLNRTEERTGHEWGEGKRLLDNPREQSQETILRQSGETILRPSGADQWSGLPPTHTTFKPEPYLDGAPLMEDHFKRDAELKSHERPSGFNDGTTILDGRSHDAILRDQSAFHENMQDATMRDATIHDGRSRPPVHAETEANPLDALPLADRVVAGVKAGDPLSSSTLKKTSIEKIKKTKKEKKFGADEHLKTDKGLIPHEHLKKQESLLAADHLSGGPILKDEEHRTINERATLIAGADNLTLKEENLEQSLKKDKKKDKKLKKEKQSTKDVNVVEGAHFQDSPFKEEILKPHHDSHLNKDVKSEQDAFLVTENKDAHTDEPGAGKKGGKLKDKIHRKKEKLKEKIGFKKDELAGEEAHAPKGHEIATIKIPGIESGDRAAQEMVNHQAKAKKELNAELKEHAGHSDHFAPSEILSHGTTQLSLHENRAVDTQLPMPSKGSDAMSDQITKDQVLAKAELNAQIKNHAGEMNLVPSEIFRNEFPQDSQFESKDDRLLADFGAMKVGDDFMKGNILAKKEVNAEIKAHAGHSDQILPSSFSRRSTGEMIKEKVANAVTAVRDMLPPTKDQMQVREFQEGRLADFGAFQEAALKDDLMKDHILAKKGVNAEIKAHAGHSDQILPSSFSRRSTGEMIKEKVANAVTAIRDMLPTKDQTQVKEFQEGQLTDFGAFQEGALKDDLMKDHILAKKEVNAEIKAHAGHSDQILPSDFTQQSTGEMIKEKVVDAAIAVRDMLPLPTKDQTQVKEFQEGRLTDFGAFQEGALKDDLMKDNILAKKEVNAEIKAHAGHSDQILPSDISGGVTIHDESSNLDAHHQSFAQKLKEKVTHAAHSAAIAVKDMLPSRSKDHSQQDNFESSEEARLADFGAFQEGALKDELMKDNILAKKEVNAQIKSHAGHTDQILPSSMLG